MPKIIDIEEYKKLINELPAGQRGMLVPTNAETKIILKEKDFLNPKQVKLRLNKAAKTLGKKIHIYIGGNTVCYQVYPTPKFKIGDVGTIDDKPIGVIEKMNVSLSGVRYCFDLFDKKNQQNPWGSYFSESQITLCNGMESTALCEKCEYRFKCWTARRI
jgi:hypothetical protein